MTDYSTPPFSASGHDLFEENRNRDSLRVVAENKGLQAHGLGKYFGQKRVVRNVSLGIRRGEAGIAWPERGGQDNNFLYADWPYSILMRARFI